MSAATNDIVQPISDKELIDINTYCYVHAVYVYLDVGDSEQQPLTMRCHSEMSVKWDFVFEQLKEEFATNP